MWAPDLSYRDGRFYLVYTDVASFDSGYWDPQNYLITAPDITGPWSDPVVLHGRGFDPSLFHDDDGTSWLLALHRRLAAGTGRVRRHRRPEYDRATRDSSANRG